MTKVINAFLEAYKAQNPEKFAIKLANGELKSLGQEAPLEVKKEPVTDVKPVKVEVPKVKDNLKPHDEQLLKETKTKAEDKTKEEKPEEVK